MSLFNSHFSLCVYELPFNISLLFFLWHEKNDKIQKKKFKKLHHTHLNDNFPILFLPHTKHTHTHTHTFALFFLHFFLSHPNGDIDYMITPLSHSFINFFCLNFFFVFDQFFFLLILDAINC